LIRPSLWPALAAGLLLCLYTVGVAQGARMDGLYEAEVELEGSREQGFREALGKVLVRITGRPDAAGSPALEPLSESAANYVQQFRQAGPNRLWVSFDGAALERELGRLGQPVWGAERPNTLFWVAVDGGGDRRFIVASEAELSEEAEVRERILAAARTRGIPVVLPLLDAEDRAQAPFAEIWGDFEDSIRRASERYGVDAVLVGRLVAGDFPRGRWTLYESDGVERWTGGIDHGVQRLADLHAARFAVVTSGQSRALRLTVSGVGSVEDYGRVSRFLGGLTAVESLGVESVDDDRVVFRVALRGDPATLDEAVRLGGLLQPERLPGERELSYRVAR
jgi:uncharacterized protein